MAAEKERGRGRKRDATKERGRASGLSVLSTPGTNPRPMAL